MNALGKDLLTGAGLTPDEHRGICFSRDFPPVDCFLQHRAAADHIGKGVLGTVLQVLGGGLAVALLFIAVGDHFQIIRDLAVNAQGVVYFTVFTVNGVGAAQNICLIAADCGVIVQRFLIDFSGFQRIEHH